MIPEDDVSATATLHRWIGLLIAASSAILLAANVVTIPPYAREWSTLQLLLAPQISLVGLIGGVAAVAAFIPRLRGLDVAIVMIVGIGATVSDSRASTTGLVLYVIGAGIAFEYG